MGLRPISTKIGDSEPIGSYESTRYRLRKLFQSPEGAAETAELSKLVGCSILLVDCVGQLVCSGSLPRKDLREPQGALQIPPLRYATVGMTRGERGAQVGVVAGWEEQQIPPLRSG
jgi:hypothetical protein